jgi:hypothetical protein
MRTITVFENAREFIHACSRVRDDKSPIVRDDIPLVVHANGVLELQSNQHQINGFGLQELLEEVTNLKSVTVKGKDERVVA